MKISKAHQRLSERLQDPKVLESPEEFLGPNYKAVLDFWMILDELTEDQGRTINSREYNFYNNQFSEWDKASDEAIIASDVTIGKKFAVNAGWAAWDVYGWVADYTTRELIGMHLILEQNKPLTFFPMILDL